MSINPLLTASSVAVRTFLPFAPGLYRPPLSTSLPEVSEFATHEWLAVPTLTSLALRYGSGETKQELTLKECICVVTMEKNIVQTALQGRNGTIKEYISDGDYQVEICAALTSECDQYPKEELQKLMSFLKTNDSLFVGDDSFLGLFGITNLIVKSYGFNQETHSNRQTFNVCCLSDTAYEIKLKEDQVC